VLLQRVEALPIEPNPALVDQARRRAESVQNFWADYIFGDAWTVAAVIGPTLLATWGLVQAGAPAWWLLPLAVLAPRVQSLYRAVLRERR
jgi:hypothetical protein